MFIESLARLNFFLQVSTRLFNVTRICAVGGHAAVDQTLMVSLLRDIFSCFR